MEFLNNKIRSKKIEQGASTKRIGQYLRRWLGWSLVCVVLSSSAMALPDGTALECATTAPTTFSNPDGTTTSISTSAVGFTTVNPLIFTPPNSICFTLNPPDQDDTLCEGTASFTFLDTTPFYLNVTTPGVPFRCAYEVSVTPTGAGAFINQFRATATAVPIFTPLGLIATVSGLLWFGRRRKAIKVTNN